VFQLCIVCYIYRKSACYSTETAYIYKFVAWYVSRVPQIYLGYSKPLDDTDLDTKQAYLILC
jgi:hypothetical protein